MTKANSTTLDFSEEKFSRLTRFNLIMGFLHLIQGILMIVLSNDTTYPIFTNFLGFNIETLSLQSEAKLLYELRFGPAVAAFLLISAVAHLYLATVGNKKYKENLLKGMNPTRFYEYALSSSLMIVLIGMLSGVWDLGAIILIFGINAMMNLFGIMMEYHNQKTEETNWISFIYGSIAGIFPWIVIFLYFFGSVSGGGEGPQPLCILSTPPSLYSLISLRSIWFCNTKKSDRGRITSLASALTLCSAWYQNPFWPGSFLPEHWHQFREQRDCKTFSNVT